MIAQRIERARKSSGLSLRQAAEQVGVSQTAIQKFEKGLLTPSSTHLIALSKAYHVRTEYFFRSFEVEISEVEYRKRSKAPKKLLNRIEGDVRDQAERWLELMNFYPEPPVAKFEPPSCLPNRLAEEEQIEDLAECVRAEWHLGSNAIPDLIDTLESRGLNVITTKVPSDAKFDGLAASINGDPYVVVSSEWPGDRQRFTIAHELGHLLLKGLVPDDLDEEKLCNRFAGAFLMPKEKVIEALGERRRSFELQELALLKEEFGLSMQSILYRALQCGVINFELHRRIFMEFSKKGWRKVEPGPKYEGEKPLLFRQLLFRALGENYIGESKAAELLGVSVSKFHSERDLAENNAAAG